MFLLIGLICVFGFTFFSCAVLESKPLAGVSIFLIISFVVGSISYNILNTQKEQEYENKYYSVIATIIDVDTHTAATTHSRKGNKRSSTVYQPTYSYVIDGIPYTLKDKQSYSHKIEVNDTVKMYYSEGDPNSVTSEYKIHSEDQVIDGTNLLSIFFLGIPLLMAIGTLRGQLGSVPKKTKKG